MLDYMLIKTFTGHVTLWTMSSKRPVLFGAAAVPAPVGFAAAAAAAAAAALLLLVAALDDSVAADAELLENSSIGYSISQFKFDFI